MVVGFSLTMHGQIILLEEDEGDAVEQVTQPQNVAPAPTTTQPAQNGFSLVDEEEEAAKKAAKEEAARVEAERKAAEKAAKEEAERVEAERKAAEKAAKEEAARIEAERKAAEEAARKEAERVEAERKAAEEAAAAEAKRVEAERQAAEAAAAEEAARVEAERKAAEEAAAEEAARLEAERKAAEEAAAAKAEAERQEAERLAAEEAARIEEERKAAEAAVVVAAPVPVPTYDTQKAPAQQTAPAQDAAPAQQTAPAQDAPANDNKAVDAALEAQRAALKAAEDARLAAAKADSLLRLQREQEAQLRILEAQRQAEIEAKAKAEAELMERARQEAEMRAKARAEAEYRAQLEAERKSSSRYEEEQVEHENIFKRFYRRNGVNHFTLLSAGYTTYFYLPNSGHKAAEDAFKRHLLTLEIFEWRAKCFGMQMFNFEMGLNSVTKGQLFEHGNAAKNGIETTGVAKEMWFAYKPAMKFYIPCTKWLAIELYGGVEVDMTAVWSKVNKTYYEACPDVPEQNFFFAPFGGLGCVFYPVHAIPIELKAEYRHPMQIKGRGNMNIIPQGVYVTAQIHLATRTKKR